MDLQLKGKTVVVTGASKGIGLAVVRAFAAEGARVVAAARTASAEPVGEGSDAATVPVGVGSGVVTVPVGEGSDVVTGLAGVGFGVATGLAGVGSGVATGPAGELPDVVAVQADLTTPEGVRALAERAGDVDVLVNNLGGVLDASMRAGGFLDIDDETWLGTFQLNLFATVRVTRSLLPGLLRRRGVVVNVSSIGARAAFKPIDYGAAKAALTNLTKGLAEEFGGQGLRALTVSPGPTRTRNWGDPDGYAGELARAAGVELDEFLARLPGQMGITTGRLTEPEETAALVAFLASPVSGNLTGADFLADGGVIKTV